MNSTRARLFVLAALWLLATAPAVAQIPDTFSNLQLLDKDLSRGEIVGIMRDWAGGLGVRCAYCHVGPDNLVGMDFASDEKAVKRTARRMLEMSRALNRKLLADLPTAEPGRRAQVASCYTCHRGQSKPPRNIGVVLGEAARDQGVAEAITEFKRLRAEFYGRGMYDLDATALIRLAQPLAERGRFEDAATVVEAGLEIDPRSTDLLLALAMAKAQSGDVDEAKRTLERALRIEPENATLRGALARITSTADSEPE